jgi:ribokinase
MEKKLDVICVGKTTIDQFLTLNQTTVKYHLDTKTGYLSFKHGEKIDVDGFEFCLGGNAANVAIGLSRLRISSGLSTEIGDDEFSDKIYHDLARDNIDRSHVIRAKNIHSSFSVIINYKGERTILGLRMQRANDFHFDDIFPRYVFLTSLEKEWQKPYKKALAYIEKEGGKLIFNPGTTQLREEGRDLVLQTLAHSDILFVNKEEAEILALGHEKRKIDNERDYIHELLSRLQKMGAKTVVITNGSHGSHAIDTLGKMYFQGLVRGEVVERTGAGDAYTAGFLAATIYGKSVKEAMKWGAVDAVSVVGKVGANAGLLQREALEKRVREI